MCEDSSAGTSQWIQWSQTPQCFRRREPINKLVFVKYDIGLNTRLCFQLSSGLKSYIFVLIIRIWIDKRLAQMFLRNICPLRLWLFTYTIEPTRDKVSRMLQMHSGCGCMGACG